MTVGELGERALIERIRARFPPAPKFVIVGIGDDAAVVEPDRNRLEVLTTDCQVEGVHFDQTFVGAADIGHKALAVNLSDLAAMGATPRVALLSLVLPPAFPVAGVDALVDGMAALAARARIAIVGGNIARSPGPLIVDVTATGSVHSRRVLTRGGARAGDDLYVTGALGGAAAGLRLLRQGARSAGLAVDRYRRPEPRLKFGVLLGRNRAARACVDLSDGLADGVRQIGEASGVGAIIDADALPIEDGATLRDALGGGEDYELLFAVSPRQRGRLKHARRLAGDLAVTRIGRVTADRAVLLSRNGSIEELPAGFEHFAPE
ncbi:MAG TPA: thiamine-phosphate kinase [Vicinamibacterales bacterium]|nr:thiamine-phosphate kinase [Vicinamibacterales bacterium]